MDPPSPPMGEPSTPTTTTRPKRRRPMTDDEIRAMLQDMPLPEEASDRPLGNLWPHEDGTVGVVDPDAPYGPAWQAAYGQALQILESHPDYPFMVAMAAEVSVPSVESLFQTPQISAMATSMVKMERKATEGVETLRRDWDTFQDFDAEMRRYIGEGGDETFAAFQDWAQQAEIHARRYRVALLSGSVRRYLESAGADGSPPVPEPAPRGRRPRAPFLSRDAFAERVRVMASDLVQLLLMYRSREGEDMGDPTYQTMLVWLENKTLETPGAINQRRNVIDAISWASDEESTYEAIFMAATIHAAWKRALYEKNLPGVLRESKEGVEITRGPPITPRKRPEGAPGGGQRRPTPIALWWRLVREVFEAGGGGPRNPIGSMNSRAFKLLFSMAAGTSGDTMLDTSNALSRNRAAAKYSESVREARTAATNLAAFFDASTINPNGPRNALRTAVQQMPEWQDRQHMEESDEEALEKTMSLFLTSGIDAASRAIEAVRNWVAELTRETDRLRASVNTAIETGVRPLVGEGGTTSTHTDRAAWALNPVLTGNIRMPPAVIHAVNVAITLVSQTLPALAPSHIPLKKRREVLTRTPELLDLFAAVVRSYITVTSSRSQIQWVPVVLIKEQSMDTVNALLLMHTWVYGYPHARNTGVPGAGRYGGDRYSGGGRHRRLGEGGRRFARLDSPPSPPEPVGGAVMRSPWIGGQLPTGGRPRKRAKMATAAAPAHGIPVALVEQAMGWSRETIRAAIVDAARRIICEA